MIRDHEQMVSAVTQAFVDQFGDAEGIQVSMAPGRVNLIGEYTDFNDGFVFPMTLDRGVYIAARARADTTVRLWSSQYRELVVFNLDNSARIEPGSWPCYSAGVAVELFKQGLISRGFDAVIDGNLDLQAGLSSSAALEVATAVSVRSLFGFELDQVSLVKLCHHVEHHYAEVFCGVMDQFACGMGEAGHALFLDCRSLSYENTPVALGDYRILIMNTGVKRALASSAYNERRAQCDEAVRRLVDEGIQAESLRDISSEQLGANKQRLPDLILRRARHVVGENQRVIDAVAALKAGDLNRLGELMLASHRSLSEDFEVSCEELDFLVRNLNESDDVLGARMTGAGFGGCAVALVAADATQNLVEELSSRYSERFGLTLTTMVLDDNRSAGVVLAN